MALGTEEHLDRKTELLLVLSEVSGKMKIKSKNYFSKWDLVGAKSSAGGALPSRTLTARYESAHHVHSPAARGAQCHGRGGQGAGGGMSVVVASGAPRLCPASSATLR